MQHIYSMKYSKGGEKMTEYRLANNTFEVDMLPPFGKSEVSITGEAAIITGAILALGLVAIYAISN